MNKMHSEEWNFNDVVFDQRNKSYGAYALREGYEKYALAGLLWATMLVASVLAIPYVLTIFRTVKEEVQNFDLSKTIEMIAPPKDEIIPPKMADPTPPPPQRSTIQHLAWVITNQQTTDEVATLEELEKLDPGKETRDGDGTFTELPEDDGTNNRNKVGLDDGNNKPVEFPELMPQFPGGEEELMRYLAKNIHYPQVAKEIGTQGTVYVGFVVDKYGHITNVELLRGIGAGCDEEAVRVVSGMPRWTPGRQGGRPVNVQYRLPIRFVLGG